MTVLSYSKSSVDAMASFETMPKDSEERVDDEDEIEYSLEDHTKSAGQDVVAEAIADLRKIVPRRPHLLGMGWLEARNLPMR